MLSNYAVRRNVIPLIEESGSDNEVGSPLQYGAGDHGNIVGAMLTVAI
jgi:hypothetical protein